jgi:hypothetical protein
MRKLNVLVHQGESRLFGQLFEADDDVTALTY